MGVKIQKRNKGKMVDVIGDELLLLPKSAFDKKSKAKNIICVSIGKLLKGDYNVRKLGYNVLVEKDSKLKAIIYVMANRRWTLIDEAVICNTEGVKVFIVYLGMYHSAMSFKNLMYTRYDRYEKIKEKLGEINIIAPLSTNAISRSRDENGRAFFNLHAIQEYLKDGTLPSIICE